MKDLKIYDNVIKSIVKRSGGYREKDIMKNPYIIRKTETKQQELEKICSEYNNLAVGNIKYIYKDKYIRSNMEI